jgi:hypothetical protein
LHTCDFSSRSRKCLPFRSTRIHPRFSCSVVHVAWSLVFCAVFYWSLFVLLSFFFWPLCCLSFFDWQILITPVGIFKLFLYMKPKNQFTEINNVFIFQNILLYDIWQCFSTLKSYITIPGRMDPIFKSKEMFM